jgi:hypothetical protein
MNNRQKFTLIMAALLVALNIIFPPYIIEYNGNILKSGYSLIFSIPSYNNLDARIDINTFLAQLIAIIVLGTIVFFIFMNNNLAMFNKKIHNNYEDYTESENNAINENRERSSTSLNNNFQFHNNNKITRNEIEHQQKKVYILLKIGIILSLIWLFGIGSLIAFRNGLKAKKIINKNPKLSGKSGAWWCLIVGSIGILLLIPILILTIINNII